MVRLDIDLGFDVRATKTVGISGVKFFGGRDEVMSKLRLQTILPIGSGVTVISKTRDKSDGMSVEYFADILVMMKNDACSVADMMVEEGLAVRDA